MVVLLVLLVVAGAVAFRTTTPDERAMFLERSVVVLRQVQGLVAESNRQLAPYHDILRARTRWPLATVTIAGSDGGRGPVVRGVRLRGTGKRDAR